MKKLIATLFLLTALAGCTPAFPLVMDTRPPTPTPLCAIKGNIRNGQKIYFTHDSINYQNVKVNEAAGERWFCTETEAQAAGWRKAGK